MNTGNMYNLCDLFAQLGMDCTPEDVEKFIDDVAPIPKDIPLYKASCWTPSQAEFLQQAITDDAEWALVVEKLDARLR